MRWVRYRYNPGVKLTEWDYIQVEDAASDEEITERIDTYIYYSWSYSYRDLEHEVIQYPPLAWLEKQLIHALSRLVTATREEKDARLELERAKKHYDLQA